jgi:uncharacterized membrane protein HdeD (DUF308 family)
MMKTNWQTLLIQGLIALVFGLLVLGWPGLSLGLLLGIFAVYALLSGIFIIIGALRQRGTPKSKWLWQLLGGIPSVAIGVATFLWPQMTGLVLLYLIALNALVLGIIQMVVGVRLRTQISFWWLALVGGLLSVAFGLLAFFWPGATALTFVWLIGGYAVLFGGVLIGQAYMVRSWTKAQAMPPAAPPPAANTPA